MDGFIYVFNREDRDTLVSAGYHLLKEDNDSHVYVFVNEPDRPLTFSGEYTILNTLTF
jgi:hypothetical protein